MRNYVLFFVCFFYIKPLAAHKVSLDRYAVDRAKSFVKKLPQFFPLQNKEDILNDVLNNRELCLRYSTDQTDEQREDYPNKRDLNYVLSRLEDLDFLEKLTLTGFGLKKIPTIIFTMNGLKHLDLSDNEIEEVPQDIGQLRALQELDLSDNYISKLPDRIGELTKLMRLRLQENALDELPENFGDLKQMRRLDLSHNAFRYVPQQMLNFEKMTRLDMEDNLISWVPSAYASLNKLKKFDLKENPLVGVGWPQEGKLGARELRALLGKRVWVSPEIFEGVAQFQAISRKKAIEDSPWVIQKLGEAVLFEAHEHDIAGEQVFEKMKALWDGLNVEDEGAPNYLDHSLLYEPEELQTFLTVEFDVIGGGEISDAEESNDSTDRRINFVRYVPRDMTNAEMMRLCVWPKIKGFTHQFFEDDQDKTYRNKGWQPATADIPAFRNAFIETLILIEKQEDITVRNNAFMMVLKGILHCPEAQKSAYDTIIAQFKGGAEVEADSLPVILQKGLAKLKEHVFLRAMNQDNNAQNTHLLQYYKDKLGGLLGLSTATPDFVDKIGRMGFDRFFGRSGNALAYFFSLFTPLWVATELCDASFKINPREMGTYLIQNRLVDYQGDEKWWQGLFTADPTESDAARVNPAAVIKALQHMGYVKNK